MKKFLEDRIEEIRRDLTEMSNSGCKTDYCKYNMKYMRIRISELEKVLDHWNKEHQPSLDRLEELVKEEPEPILKPKNGYRYHARECKHHWIQVGNGGFCPKCGSIAQTYHEFNKQNSNPFDICNMWSPEVKEYLESIKPKVKLMDPENRTIPHQFINSLIMMLTLLRRIKIVELILQKITK